MERMKFTSSRGVAALPVTAAMVGAVAASVAPAWGAAAKKAQSATPKQPNILCVVCEDISPYVGCFGDKVATTPNLDAFSREAIRYNMYTPIGVSAPSRFGLITGLFPSCYGANYMRSGNNLPQWGAPYQVVTPPGVKCYTEFLRAAGYYCTNNDKTDYQFNPPLTAWDENGKTAHWRNRPDRNMPFLAIFNLFVTHESQIWERNKLPLTTDPKDIVLPPYYPDDSVVRRDMAVLYSNITEMDRQAQALFDQVKEDGLLDNTIIIWYSDNGGPIPRGKREVYESGQLVPFMIRFPDGYNKGKWEDRLVMFPDIPATILSLAGIKPPAYMQGKAFLGKYEAAPRRFVYGAHDRMDEQLDKIGSVRDARFRYIYNYMPEQAGYTPNKYRLQMPMMRRMVELYNEGKLNAVQSRWFTAPRPQEEFYDVKADPWEINNLIDDPKYAGDIARLKKEYDRWMANENKDWLLPEKVWSERMWPGRVQPVVEVPVLKATAAGVEATCATDGASMAYQVNGQAYGRPKQWMLYTGPIRASKGDVVTVVAVSIGKKNSKPATLTL